MPLSPAVSRPELHLRRIDLRGYRRDDGLYDVEARMIDTKCEELVLSDGRMLPPGEALHDMWIRLVIDDRLKVLEVAASTDRAPFTVCGEAAAGLASLKGLRVGPGWSRAIRHKLAAREGCTHLIELLAPLATVAFQTVAGTRQDKRAAVDADGKPRKIDSCYAYASNREVVQRLWPMHYDGTTREEQSTEK